MNGIILLLSVVVIWIAANNGEKNNKQSKNDLMEKNKVMVDSVAIRHQHVTINGIKYHYAETGEGPLVIMLHGFPELWYSWRHPGKGGHGRINIGLIEQ